MAGTPRLNEGRELLARYGCVRCHTIRLPDGSMMAATDDPPPLTHIADKTTREWVYAWLKDPASYASSATMPNFQLSDADARDISAFLMATSTPQPGDTLAVPASSKAPDPAAGASLYGESFCASCHATQNAAGNLVGGNIGPELTRIGSKVKPEWLQAWLKDRATTMRIRRCRIYRWTESGTHGAGWVCGEQDGFRLPGECASGCADAAADRARKSAGDGVRMRRLSRDSRRREAGELCARTGAGSAASRWRTGVHRRECRRRCRITWMARFAIRVPSGRVCGCPCTRSLRSRWTH